MAAIRRNKITIARIKKTMLCMVGCDIMFKVEFLILLKHIFSYEKAVKSAV